MKKMIAAKTTERGKTEWRFVYSEDGIYYRPKGYDAEFRIRKHRLGSYEITIYQLGSRIPISDFRECVLEALNSKSDKAHTLRERVVWKIRDMDRRRNIDL